MTLEEQLQWFDRHADKAYSRCLKDYKVRKSAILAEARQRVIDGFDLYGAEGFSWSYDRLHDAELQEFADAVNYRLFKMYQSWY